VLTRFPEALQERFPEGRKTVGEALVDAAETAATGRPEAMAAVGWGPAAENAS